MSLTHCRPVAPHLLYTCSNDIFTMDELCDIVDRLRTTHHNTHHSSTSLSLSQVVQFIAHASCLKQYILLSLRATDPHDHAPQWLPSSVQSLLADAANVNLGEVGTLWTVLKDLIWDDDYVRKLETSPYCLQSNEEGAFHTNYTSLNLGKQLNFTCLRPFGLSIVHN